MGIRLTHELLWDSQNHEQVVDRYDPTRAAPDVWPVTSNVSVSIGSTVSVMKWLACLHVSTMLTVVDVDFKFIIMDNSHMADITIGGLRWMRRKHATPHSKFEYSASMCGTWIEPGDITAC
jgi:hypothetical protein